MKKLLYFTISLFLTIPLLFPTLVPKLLSKREIKSAAIFAPSEYFYYQRAYPFGHISTDKYRLEFLKRNINQLGKTQLNTSPWTLYGPTNIGGRITALDVDKDRNTIYIATAAGGIFKSTNFGTTWQPKTDFYQSLSMGAIKIDPNNKNILYAGTGEANINIDSYAGFGILKSTDFGETWNPSGLTETEHIAEIEIHPLNSKLLFVAASGPLYSKSTNKGVYKSTDAGATWQKSLFLNDSTSCIDVAVDPGDTNIVYAAMWERLRGLTFRKSAGLSSAIYKSTDCGKTWNKLAGGLPAQTATTGRISIAVAKSDPNKVYALYKKSSTTAQSDNVFMGFYASSDKGVSWQSMNTNISGFSNFGWYFGSIEVDPINANTIYFGEVDVYKSTDRGVNWANITNAYSTDDNHPDMHALWIDPANSNKIVLGNDGGVFITSDGGNNWVKSLDLPISQFYAATIDYLQPQRIYGGLQDNNSVRTLTGATNDWEAILGGDGFYAQVDYTNSNVIYCEYQNGGIARSTDGGSSFSYISGGLDLSRTNWCSPYQLDPSDPTKIYFGSYKINYSTDRGDSWTIISPDLTRGANGRAGTITTLSVQMMQNSTDRVIYVGTDDAKVWVSKNSGTSWIDITGNLPQRYVTRVMADKRNPAIAYVTLSGLFWDEETKHIYRTTNYGSTWNPISGNLPDVPLNAIAIDYNHPSLIYVGGDVGVYYSYDYGTTWKVLGSGLPNAPVADLVFHQGEKVLFAATHGRSVFLYDVSDIESAAIDPIKRIDDLSLSQNYPNPVSKSKFGGGKTVIDYSIDAESNVKLELFNTEGELVRELFSGYLSPGKYTATIRTAELASGIYYCKLSSMNKHKVIKMVVLK